MPDRIRGEVGGENHHAVERLELFEQHVDDGVCLPEEPVFESGGTSRGDSVRLVEQHNRVFFAGETEHGRHVLRRCPHPHRLHFGVADDEQPASERVRDRLGADRLARPARSREVEGERQAGRMAFAQAPAVEDQVVAGDVGQRLIERAARRRGQDHVVKAAPRPHCFNNAP